MAKHTLIVFYVIPATIEFYLIPNSALTQEDVNLLDKCTGRFVEASDDEEVFDSFNEKLNLEWSRFKLEASSKVEATISRVYTAGFLI